MNSILRNTAIITGIIAIIIYAIYRWRKVQSSKPISYEDIVTNAISEIKKSNKGRGEYSLVIIPPMKSREFIEQNPSYFENVSVADLKRNVLVLWMVQKGEDVICQKAIISKSLAQDFVDVVPSDKIYRKKIIL
jgi:hypothetical protein